MNIIGKLMQAYFNYAYNPVYDFTTGKLNHYRKLQESCIGKLDLQNNDRVLCVGLGTGNEIVHILKKNKSVSIIAIDYSHTGLKKAHMKALELGKEIELHLMDVRVLQFPVGSFDKVLCIHVTDFIEEKNEITKEIVRVLKKGGQFVITFPSEKEGAKLGFNLLKDSIRHNDDSGKKRVIVIYKLLFRMFLGCVYLPLLLRPKRRPYSRSELETMISKLTTGDFQIEEDVIYQDFIVYGEK